VTETILGRALDEVPKVGPAALCMGVFDGVHRGHLALIEATCAAAAQRGARSVALLFDPHPDEVIHPGTTIPRLATPNRNLRMLEKAGIDHAVPIRFDAALRSLSPEQFLAAMAPAIELRALVMTRESAFGRGRAGTPEAMRAHGRAAGFDLVLAEEVVLDGGTPIASGRIRDAVLSGRIRDATRLLGHPPTIEATLVPASVAAGPGQLRVIIDYSAALPPQGRYPVEIRAAVADVPATLVVSYEGGAELLTEGGDARVSGVVVIAIMAEKAETGQAEPHARS
jgi:riboflavin kinase / FMN adenylyltransferase